MDEGRSRIAVEIATVLPLTAIVGFELEYAVSRNHFVRVSGTSRCSIAKIISRLFCNMTYGKYPCPICAQ
jgi:hypothetical protein